MSGGNGALDFKEPATHGRRRDPKPRTYLAHGRRRILLEYGFQPAAQLPPGIFDGFTSAGDELCAQLRFRLTQDRGALVAQSPGDFQDCRRRIRPKRCFEFGRDRTSPCRSNLRTLCFDNPAKVGEPGGTQ